MASFYYLRNILFPPIYRYCKFKKPLKWRTLYQLIFLINHAFSFRGIKLTFLVWKIFYPLLERFGFHLACVYALVRLYLRIILNIKVLLLVLHFLFPRIISQGLKISSLLWPLCKVAHVYVIRCLHGKHHFISFVQ